MYQFFDVRSNLFKKKKKEEREENGWKIRVRVVNNFCGYRTIYEYYY